MDVMWMRLSPARTTTRPNFRLRRSAEIDGLLNAKTIGVLVLR